ncbi:MAG: HAD family phosphatase [Candidatus Omnitrophica bacterium]|nr:HAD family phosphatase [Candidatus Omnitrophota bacterium]
MDGVITDTMPYHFRAWRKVFGAHGLKVSKFDVYRREGQKGTKSIQEIFAQAGILLTPEMAGRIIAEKELLFKKILRQRFIPGSRTLVSRLSRRGLRLALVTGTSRHEVEHTLPKGLLSLFQATITGSDVRLGKPDPEPYLKALKALKINAREAVVIENAPFGIMSAKAAGITCYAVTTSLPKEYLGQADKVFKNMKSLTDVLIKEVNV